MSRIDSRNWIISTDRHFQNGRHNAAKIQHCPLSSKFDMWVDYDQRWICAVLWRPFFKWRPLEICWCQESIREIIIYLHMKFGKKSSYLVMHKTKSQKIQRHCKPTNPTQGTPYQWTHWCYTVLRRSITFTSSGLNCHFKFPFHNVNMLLLFIVNKFATCYMILKKNSCPIYDKCDAASEYCITSMRPLVRRSLSWISRLSMSLYLLTFGLIHNKIWL
jgi:hypothetical protein